MADYGNLFSPDYWTPEGVAWRAGDRKKAAHELAIKQDESNRAPWEALGSFIGDAGKNIGSWLGSMAPSEETASGILEGQSQVPSPFMPTMQRANSTSPAGGESGDDILAALGGKFNSPTAITPPGNSVLANPNFEPEAEGELDATEILKRLGQHFSFDRNSVDTAPLDEVLNNNINQLNGVRDTTNQNFQKSDANIGQMYGAHEKDVKGQQGEIASRGAANEKAIGGIFDKTIAANNAQDAQRRKADEEMYRRLGIAPAAAGPDLVGQAIAEGNNQSQQSRNTRVAEAKTNTQTDISRNNTLASAVGNDGLQRRSDLNMRLQEILGELGSKEADYRNDYQQNKLELQQRAEDQSYDRWLQDRQFDMGLFNSVNSANSAAIDGEADRQNRLDVANINAAARTAGGGSGSSQAWLESASPEFQSAFADVARKVNVAQDPQEAMRMLADPKYGLMPNEVVTKITDYANLGRVKADMLQ